MTAESQLILLCPLLLYWDCLFLLDHLFSPLKIEGLRRSRCSLIICSKKEERRAATFTFSISSECFSDPHLPACPDGLCVVSLVSSPGSLEQGNLLFSQGFQGSKCQNARSYPVHALGLSTSESTEGVGRDLSD